MYNPFSFILTNDSNLTTAKKKLFTHEDRHGFHKVFGMCSLVSFFYRYGYVYPTTGTLGFAEGTPLDWASMSVHTLLAFSSIIFRVPSKRIASKPMMIYEEYRQHAMVFTARCFSVFAACILWPISEGRPAYVVPLVVMVHHLIADWITNKHGNGSTAVRATSDKATAVATSKFYKHVGKFYSFYQFLAIGSHVFTQEPYLADMAFNAIIAIQSSAFMMTLYKKRLVNGKGHMLIYSFCLVLSAYHICRTIGWAITGMVLIAFLVRINLPRAWSNKYVIWAVCRTSPWLAGALMSSMPRFALLARTAAD